MSPDKSSGSDTKHIVIVGAGIAGISTAIALKRQLNFENFTIYERGDAIGGTWKVNTYPGCGSDTPGHWYSLSTDLNPYWKSHYVNHSELLAYWQGLWHKYNLEEHTILNTSVVDSVWRNDTQRYTVTVENGQTKERTQVQAAVIFYATGGFETPFFPENLKGLESFKGDLFHSARWRHDLPLEGKRVGVIGNGCSAAQFIPEISRDYSVNVVNFCRTPQWYLDRGNYDYSPTVQNMFADIPGAMRLYRYRLMLKIDIVSVLYRMTNKRLLSAARQYFEDHIKSKAPKRYLEQLVPKYAPGCKRIILDPGYLDCLHQPNVSLNWSPIESIVGEGIKLKNGETVPLDVIIFATGYSLEPTELKVTGSKGRTIHEYFDRKDGPIAYLGSCIPGFPNLFVFPGFNAATGHASLVFTEEVQINYALKIIRPVLEGKARSFEVTQEATNEYNEWLQRRLKDSVWTDCASYYRTGREGSGRIVTTFPGPVTLFWWLCRRPNWEHFHAVGADFFQKERRRQEMTRWCSFAISLTLFLGFYFIKGRLSV